MSRSSPGSGGTGGTLVMGYPTIPSQLDPSIYSGGDSEYTMGNVYITPMRYVKRDIGHGYPEISVQPPEVEPWLAKSLEPSTDLKKFKLVLRSDILSSAGNPLSAEDLRWT